MFIVVIMKQCRPKLRGLFPGYIYKREIHDDVVVVAGGERNFPANINM